MSRLVRFACVPACLAAALAARALADPPAPITPALYEFPGSVAGPFSAVSAGVGLADRWLGDEPADNPAVRPRRAFSLCPAIVRVSRQDLAAGNRHFSQTAAFFDGAGGWMAYGAGRLGLDLYLYQPVLRHEDNAFERGTIGGAEPPAVVRSNATVREIRGGVALSYGFGPGRVGAAGEWTRRDDAYHVVERSAAPDAGERRVSFSGDGFGFEAGTRLDFGGEGAGAFSLGASARYVPALTLDGEVLLNLGSGTGLGVVSVERESGWEGGISARYAVTPSLRVLGGIGGHTAQDWRGFGVTSGAGGMWTLAMDYHDVEVPWTFRLGLGREHQEQVPMSAAGVLGLGVGWRFEETTIDVGLLRRSLQRAGSPNSFDDRLVGSLSLDF
jgi:hypothetical protein